MGNAAWAPPSGSALEKLGRASTGDGRNEGPIQEGIWPLDRRSLKGKAEAAWERKVNGCKGGRTSVQPGADVCEVKGKNENSPDRFRSYKLFNVLLLKYIYLLDLTRLTLFRLRTSGTSLVISNVIV
jgi:hypothetical protein